MPPAEGEPPVWLRQALDAYPERPRALVNPHAEVAAGDLRVAQRDDLRRIVVVEAVDPDDGVAIVLLTTPDIDDAIDSDLVMRPEETGLGFALAVESTIRSTVFIAQLGRLLGRISDADLRTIRVLRAMTAPPNADESHISDDLLSEESDSSVPWDRRGMPLLGRDDSRWSSRLREVDEMRVLSSAVAQSIVEELDVGEEHRGLAALSFAAASGPAILVLRGFDTHELAATLVSEGEQLRVHVEARLSDAGGIVEVPLAPVGESFALVVPLQGSEDLDRATGDLVVRERDVVRLASDPRLLEPGDLQAQAAGSIEVSIRAASVGTRRGWQAMLSEPRGLDRMVARAIERALSSDAG